MPAVVRHCTWLVLLALPLAASAQPPSDDTWSSTYRVVVQGRSVGSEQVSVTRDDSGLAIRSTGGMAGGGFTLRSAEVVYRADGTADRLRIEATIRQQPMIVETTVRDGQAVSRVTQGDTTDDVTHAVRPDTVLLPNNVFGAVQGLATRLLQLQAGGTIPIYVAPQAEVLGTVSAVAIERLQTADGTFEVRRHTVDVTGQNTPLTLLVWVEAATGRLVRYSIPNAALDVVREDLTSVFTREIKSFRENDQTLLVPALGFNLGTTISRPGGRTAPDRKAKNVERLPAIVLVAGSGSVDRDGVMHGIPIMGQLAASLADAGFLVARYDRRGAGQSGGRAESATLSDYAEDVLTVVRHLRKQKDVDRRRVFVVGHGEGGSVALLAASRSGDIAGVVTLATSGVQGSELVLEQQKQSLSRLAIPDDEKQRRVQLQMQIMNAVLTGEGWDGVPEALRKQSDTPYFQSVLAFDPAVVMKKVKQPLLIVHGALDRQVPLSNAELLNGLALQRNKGVTDLVMLPGINHLLVPANTGEVSEYGSLGDAAAISPDVSRVIAEWLGKLPER